MGSMFGTRARRESMKLAKFQYEFSGSTLDLVEFAEAAKQLVDCEDLQKAAEAYLGAAGEFRYQLGRYDVEVG